MTISVVAIDLQYDFFESQPDNPTRLTKALCLPGVRRLLSLAREKGWQVIHVVTEHLDVSTLPAHLERLETSPYCIEGTDGSQLVDGLFEESDSKVVKRSYSGFVDTELEETLNGSEIVLICGVAADCCVFLTAFDATTRFDKQVFLPYEAVSSSDQEGYVFGLRSIAKSAGPILRLETLETLEPEDWFRSSVPLEQVADKVGGWFDAQQKLAQDVLQTSHDDVRAAVVRLEGLLR